MKKTLLLLFACLFGALSGVKAWTSVDPENGKAYYLLNVEQNQFFCATDVNGPYRITSDLASATPVVMESGEKFRFYLNGTAYKLYHNNGTPQLNTGGTNFSRSHDKDMGFEIYSGTKIGKFSDSRRWLYVTEANGGCYFPSTDDKSGDIHWKFVPVEEVYNELIKSTAPTCAAAAEASYVKPARGWTKITELPANLDDYYYAIVSAEVPGIMLNARAGGNNDSNGKAVYYSTAAEVDASQHLDYLWTITNNSAYNCQSFRNVEYNTHYMQTRDNHAENIVAQYETAPSEWTQMKFEYDARTTSWTILNQRFDGQYLGAWDKKVPEDGLEFCGNNSKDGQYGRFVGHFLIYAISKNDYTYKITNSDFSNATWNTGWSGTGDNKNLTFAKGTDSRFTGVSAEMWNGQNVQSPAGNIYQTVTSLPAGTYTLSAKVFSDLKCELYATTAAKENSLAINGCALSTQSLEFAISEAGNVTIGLRHNGESTNTWNWIAVDDFTLIYTGPYHEIDVDPGTKTQTYEGTFTEAVDLTPTAECPIVDITGATFTGDITAHFGSNPNGIIYATSAQKIDMDTKAGGPVKNVISSAYDVCERLVITDGYSFVAPFDFEATNATYSRTVGASTNFGTICVPFALTSNEDIQYYTTDQITGGVLKLTKVDNVAAGTPAIFKKQDGEATNITASITATAVKKDAGSLGESVTLKGAFVQTVVGDINSTSNTPLTGKYYIKNNQFCQGVDYFTVNPFRAYIDSEINSGARLTLQVEDEATAISELKKLDEKQGLEDGKYLIGGKIIVVKAGQQFNVNGVIYK